MRITDSSVKRRIATSVIAAALVVLGAYGLWKLPVNFLPDIVYPLIRVHIYWTGATPEEIDKNLADPIERQLASVEGLDYLESSAIEGMYTALVNFQYGVDVNVAYQDVLAAMARAARNLPPMTPQSVRGKVNSNSMVPERFSSANRRMVNNGTINKKMTARLPKKGRYTICVGVSMLAR